MRRNLKFLRLDLSTESKFFCIFFELCLESRAFRNYIRVNLYIDWISYMVALQLMSQDVLCGVTSVKDGRQKAPTIFNSSVVCRC